jgi:hypothetical protein
VADDSVKKITEAAAVVMAALEPLSPEERSRVLQSAAALHGISMGMTYARQVVDAMNQPQPVAGGKRLSIVEFLEQKAPATNAQRIACFAFYREHVDGQPKFARSDLEHYFADAKLPRPGNYDRDFSGAAREGWIHEDGAESYLTQKGERAVVQGFDGKARPRGATASKKRKDGGQQAA